LGEPLSSENKYLKMVVIYNESKEKSYAESNKGNITATSPYGLSSDPEQYQLHEA
jgi:hypothetical protein